MRINLIGGASAGATTLGKALAAHFDIPHFDADDYFHLPTEPPYQAQREANERDRMLAQDLGSAWVLSGGVFDWQIGQNPTHIIWLRPGRPIRMERLRTREAARGPIPGQANFLEWAAQYEAGGVDGKTAARHSAAVEASESAVLEFVNEGELEADLARLIAWLATDGFKGAPTFDE